MLEQNHERVIEQARNSVSNDCSGRLLDELFHKDRIDTREAQAIYPPAKEFLEFINLIKKLDDPASKQFISELGKTMETGTIDDKFVEAAKKVGEKCASDPEYQSLIDRFLKIQCGHNASVHADENGITFSTTQGFSHPFGGGRTTSLTIPFKGDEIRAQQSFQAGCQPPVRREIDTAEAVKSIFAPKPVQFYEDKFRSDREFSIKQKQN